MLLPSPLKRLVETEIEKDRFYATMGHIVPMMLSIILWTVIIILIAMSAKDRASLISAIGSLGQVAFAGLVWWVARQQFQLSRDISAVQRDLAQKQLRVDLFDKRYRAFNQWRDIAIRVSRSDFAEEGAFSLAIVTNEIDHVFSKQATDAVERHATLAWDLVELEENLAAFEGSPTERLALVHARRDARKATHNAFQEAIRTLRSELRLSE
jgi:hypothetical protein